MDLKVLASPDAAEFIRSHGGRLYVWADVMYCYGRACSAFLTAATEPPRDAHEFRRFEGGDFELLFSDGGLEAPDEVRLDLTGWHRKRISVHGNVSLAGAREQP